MFFKEGKYKSVQINNINKEKEYLKQIKIERLELIRENKLRKEKELKEKELDEIKRKVSYAIKI